MQAMQALPRKSAEGNANSNNNRVSTCIPGASHQSRAWLGRPRTALSPSPCPMLSYSQPSWSGSSWSKGKEAR
jgi:hypothetical protein